MKYCTHCGAALPGGAASFCPECGKRQKKAKRNARRMEKPPSTHGKQPASPQRARKNPMDENYDGYYNDIPPIDAGRRSEGLDPEQLKRVGMVVLGAVIAILLAVILMMLL